MRNCAIIHPLHLELETAPEMRPMIVISVQKCTPLALERGQLLHAIGGPPQAFLAQGSIEALNVRLLVLLVGTGDAMPDTILEHLLGKYAFEL
jgi:hypothetical protein